MIVQMQEQIQNNKITLSSAYPASKQPALESPCHEILKNTTKIDQQVTIRILQQQDIHQLKKLNIEFFPLRYDDSYYFRIINNQVYGYVAEVNIKIVGTVLKEILEKEEQKENKLKSQIKGTNRSLTQLPNKYFIKQNLELVSDQPINCRIIVGSILFSNRDSEGYLRYPWWKKLIFPQDNSIYISTLGVIGEFRKQRVAQKLLNEIIKLVENNNRIKLVYLHVIEYNMAARSLYSKMGFEVLETIHNFYHVQKVPYLGLALGKFMNGGARKQTWRQWFSKFW